MSMDNPNNIDADTGKPEGFGISSVTPTSAQSMKLSSDNWLEWLERQAGIGNASARDMWLNYMMSEKSAQTAREYESLMDSTRYQRMVEDAKKAGLNPYWSLSNLAAGNLTGQQNNYSGSHYTTAAAQKLTAQKQEETNRHNSANEVLRLLGTVISAIAVVAALA